MSLKNIKIKIKSTDRTRKVTKAMEMVSAIKMRKSQVRAITGRPYASAALSVLERMSVSLSTVKHPLTESRPVKKAAVVVVTSDKGLCGVLNSAVTKEAQRLVNDLGLPKESIDVYAFGRKGAEYFDRRGYKVVEKFENISDEVQVTDLSKISNDLALAFSEKKYDRVDVVFTNFKSTFEQQALAHTVLPLSIGTLYEIVTGIVPEKGKFSKGSTFDTKVEPLQKGPTGIIPEKGKFARGEASSNSPAFYTVEPSPEAVIDALITRLVGILFYHALLESKASEHSARMVAMKNASDKSLEKSKSLTRTFNKARQAMITREVSEIVGGIEAMATN